MQCPPGDPFDSGYVGIVYARYADDFIIGIIGNEKLAAETKAGVSQFLKRNLKLQLNEEKSKITHYLQTVPFLSYKISTRHNPEVGRNRVVSSGLTIRQKRPSGNVKLLVDIRKVINKLSEKNFCTPGGFPKPNWLLALGAPQAFSVSRGALVVRDLANYYRLASNFKQSVMRINYIVTHSLAKTFAAKFRLQSRSKVFAKAGPDLSRLITSRKKVIKGCQSQECRYCSVTGQEKQNIPYMPYTRSKQFLELGRGRHLLVCEEEKDFRNTFCKVLLKSYSGLL